MNGLLEGHRLLVTGAARGIGRAIAALALSHGARVLLADRDGQDCIEAAEALGGAAAGAFATQMDVADETSIARAMTVAAERLGGLDGLVNNAAIKDETAVEDLTLARFREVMAVNLDSVFTVSHAALPLLSASSAASIVNTLSVQALYAQPRTAAYATAKGGGANLTRALAIDLAPRGIRVNGVAPGFIDTRMAVRPTGEHEHEEAIFRDFYIAERKIPLARAGTPEDVAGAFVFLLCPLSAYITGEIVTVDGGLTATF